MTTQDQLQALIQRWEACRDEVIRAQGASGNGASHDVAGGMIITYNNCIHEAKDLLDKRRVL